MPSDHGQPGNKACEGKIRKGEIVCVQENERDGEGKRMRGWRMRGEGGKYGNESGREMKGKEKARAGNEREVKKEEGKRMKRWKMRGEKGI